MAVPRLPKEKTAMKPLLAIGTMALLASPAAAQNCTTMYLGPHNSMTNCSDGSVYQGFRHGPIDEEYQVNPGYAETQRRISPHRSIWDDDDDE
jgi:hypothetical protein